MTAETNILDEFGCHYLGDEMRLDETFRSSIPALAEASASRIAEHSDNASVIALLDELRRDRKHPLHQTIGEQTLLWWVDDDAAWHMFGELVDAIIMKLRDIRE